MSLAVKHKLCFIFAMKEPTVKTITRLAKQLGASDNQLRVWRQRQIAHQWRAPILEAAAKEGLKIRLSDIERWPN